MFRLASKNKSLCNYGDVSVKHCAELKVNGRFLPLSVIHSCFILYESLFLQLIKSHSHLKTAGYVCDKSAAFILRSTTPQQRGIVDVLSTVYLH